METTFVSSASGEFWPSVELFSFSSLFSLSSLAGLRERWNLPFDCSHLPRVSRFSFFQPEAGSAIVMMFAERCESAFPSCVFFRWGIFPLSYLIPPVRETDCSSPPSALYSILFSPHPGQLNHPADLSRATKGMRSDLSCQGYNCARRGRPSAPSISYPEHFWKANESP